MTMHIRFFDLLFFCFHRSVNDKKKTLMKSFFDTDIPAILRENLNDEDNCSSSRSESSNKTYDSSNKSNLHNRIYSDISIFLETVCKDIKMFYPSSRQDPAFVIRIFNRLMKENVPEIDI